MNYTTRYTVTKELQDTSVRQYFFSVLLGARIIPLVLLPLVAGGFVAVGASGTAWSIGIGFVCAMLVLSVSMWTRAYFQCMAQGRAGLKLMEHPNVEVTLSDVGIEYISSTGTRRHAWTKIERVVETRDFIALMVGNLPLFSLPKVHFSPEAIDFIRGKRPNQSPEPTATAVTPPAAQEPRQP